MHFLSRREREKMLILSNNYNKRGQQNPHMKPFSNEWKSDEKEGGEREEGRDVGRGWMSEERKRL